jgi:branched-chain amino acid transport system permease protein
MQQLTSNRNLVIVALLATVLIGLANVANKQWLDVLILVIMAACNAIAWNIASGYAGVFSLGHHVFFGTGAYVSTMLFLQLGLTPWIGIFASGLFAATLGVVVALVGFRYRLTGVFFGLTTLALGEVARSVVTAWNWVGGPTGLFLPLRQDPANFLFKDSRMPYFYVVLFLFLSFLAITRLIERSKMGYYLKAIREDQNAAESSGVDTYKYKTLVMGVSAGLTGVMGTFYAQFMQFFDPNVVFRFDLQLDMMLGAMVGGPGTLFGPVIGSGLFGLLGELLRNLPFTASTKLAAGSKVFYAIVLIIVALYLPNGLISLRFRRKRPANAKPKEGTGHAA